MAETPSRPQSRSATPWASPAISRVAIERYFKPAKRRRAASDEVKLFCMGYKQELVRSFTLFNNAGVAFSILSPLTALTGMYGTWGLLYGGPVAMMWSMPIVSFFSLMVALSMAEITSAYPTSGAVYYWSWSLAPPRLKSIACWVSGWVLVMGQAAFTATICHIFTDLLAVFVRMASGLTLSSGAQLGIFLAAMLFAAAASSTPNTVMAFLTSLATFWNVVSLAALVVALPAVAPRRQPLSYVYTHWVDMEELTGVRSHLYNLLLGMMLSQYLYLGFDASAHWAEETHHADVNAPRGMVAATLVASGCSYCYLLSLNLVATNPAALLDPASESGGEQAVAQLFWDVYKAAYGDGRGGLAFLTVPMAAAFMCTYQSVAANARMLFAFSRDGAVPMQRYLGKVGRRTKAPVAAGCSMALLVAVVGVPMFFSKRYVATIESMAVANTYLAYGVPILFKLIDRRGAFLPGAFQLRPWLSRAVNVLALIWVAAITVIVSLPTSYPITPQNMNYNCAGTSFVILATLAAFYCPVIGGRHWFSGPRPNLGRFDDVPSIVRRKLRLVPTATQEQQQQQHEQGQEQGQPGADGETNGGLQRQEYHQQADGQGQRHTSQPGQQALQGVPAQLWEQCQPLLATSVDVQGMAERSDNEAGKALLNDVSANHSGICHKHARSRGSSHVPEQSLLSADADLVPMKDGL